MDRRQFLLMGGSGTLVVSAGCVGFLSGSEPLTFEATKGTVAEGALSDTGYGEETVETQTITRPFSAAGQEREVEVTNWMARYERTLDLGPLGEQELGVFVVLSTPQVSILGRTFNPVGDMSNRELLGQLQSRYEGFTVGDRVDTRTIPVLGEDVEVEKFEGSATFQGREIDLFVHVATLEHEEDFVVPVAIYPQMLPGEEQKALQLYRGIEH